jgi:hypothetical protein
MRGFLFGIADLGMRIVDFKLSFWFVNYFFQSEIRNPKSEITLAPLLQRFKWGTAPLENYLPVCNRKA